MRRAGRNGEHGAVAVVVAISCVVLFAVAALAIDLGNAFVRKRDVQSQADLSALAGAQDMAATNTKTATNPAVVAVVNYLNDNQPQDDRAGGPVAVTAAQLVDGSNANGEVYFLTNDRMRVISPPALVQYGFAGVMGFNTQNVTAQATVQIRSGGGVMPFYAVSGCDYGAQTITDPPNGQVSGLNLSYASDNGSASLTSITPTQMAVNASPSQLDIYGSGFTSGSGVSKVGFFFNDGSQPTTVDNNPVSTPHITVVDNSHIVVTGLPTNVLSSAAVWYVRVYKSSGWSKVDNAQPLRIGSAILECVGSSSDGNFGSLLLPRTDSNNSASDGWLPINIAKSVQEPLTLATLPGAVSPYTCTSTTPNAVISGTSPPVLNPGTNCIDTDTGLTDTSATTGFITGGSNGSLIYPGRLDKDTTPGCGATSSNRNARWDTGIHKPGPGSDEYEINDDLLTCFLKPGLQISTITDPNYAGPAALTPDIYNSPRFFFQPVLGVEPSTGGSNKYSIVDFRPGFITDQPSYADHAGMQVGTSTQHNGISISSNKISKVKVIFFDVDALPPPPDGAPTYAYMGVGPKVIRLVN